MTLTDQTFPPEKEPHILVEELPPPATQSPPPRKRSVLGFLVRILIIFFSIQFVTDFLSHGTPFATIHRGCRGMRKQFNVGKERHHGPPKGWPSYNGTTHFELEPSDRLGLTVRGADTFGKVVFETSKISNKVVMDLDIRSSDEDRAEDISVKQEDGKIIIETPKDSGERKTYASAKISIPSNIIGTFGIPSFDLMLPRHMVDYSALPESLEIGELSINLGKGFVKTGTVKTNSTNLALGYGLVKGNIAQARANTEINIGSGNATLEATSISAGNAGEMRIRTGNGHIKGVYGVYNSTIFDVASGSVDVNVAFKEGMSEHGELSVRGVNGPSRVRVDSVAEGRTFKSTHTSVAGDQTLTYPESFEGKIDARGIVGDIRMGGDGLEVDRALGGVVGKKGDEDRNYVGVQTVKGKLDILVGKDEKGE